ncbi:MAG: zinc-dependent alcohol dehydrogenase [Rhodoglobus sp.]
MKNDVTRRSANAKVALVRAFVVTAPRTASVQEVAQPAPGPGELLVDVERVGICGTDVEFYTGEMAYLEQGLTHFPIRLGHEWTGVVTGLGTGTDPSWLGRRITGDTMLGCGTCRFCLGGKHHICPDRFEVGIQDGWPGALAEQVLIPERFAHAIPDSVSVTAAALVEPGGNSLRAVDATGLTAGGRLLVLGSGTIGLLAAQVALARGLDVEVAGERESSLALAQSLGVRVTHLLSEPEWSLVGAQDARETTTSDLSRHFDAVIDATSHRASPALAAQLVDPGGRVVYIGLSGSPSHVDTRQLALKDVTAVGILSASPGLAGAITLFASGAVIPDPLVAEVIGLSQVAERLEGRRGPNAGPGPKIHVDPRLP